MKKDLDKKYTYDEVIEALKRVLIYISTLENLRKAGVGKSPNQSFLFI